MMNFLNWLIDDAPEWVIFIVFSLGAAVIFVAVVGSLFAALYGYWLVPTLLFVVMPIYVVAIIYAKDKK